MIDTRYYFLSLFEQNFNSDKHIPDSIAMQSKCRWICHLLLLSQTWKALIESKHHLLKRNRVIGRQESGLPDAKSSGVYFLPCLGEGMKNGRDKQGISVGAAVHQRGGSFLASKHRA